LAHLGRAGKHVPLPPPRDTETRNGSENIGYEVRMSVLELIGTDVESHPRFLSLAESHTVEICRPPRVHDDRLDHRHKLGQLDRYALRLTRSQIHSHRLSAEPEMARQKHVTARRQLRNREFAPFVGHGNLVGANHFDSAAAVCGGPPQHHPTGYRCLADFGSGVYSG